VAGLGWYPCSRPKPDTIETSQAPDDGFINEGNILSIEEVK